MKTHEFTMDPAMLSSIIRKQAGTIEKAVMEGVMNSIDAGADRVEVTVAYDRITISDNGRGFADRESIELYFQRFGTPHQEGDAKYGRFRMGRGQMFAFGRNTWRTGPFSMYVDIDKGLHFELAHDLPHADGCSIKIELFAHLSQHEIYQLNNAIKYNLEYVGGSLVLNGEVINKAPEGCKWTKTTDDAYMRFNPDGHGGIRVYNMGVLTQTIPAHKLGMSGVVVSRRDLDINFARNEVLSTCQVFKRVKAEISSAAGGHVARKKNALTPAEAIALIGRIASGVVQPYDVRQVKFIPDVNERFWSPQAIQNAQFEYFTVAASGDIRGDKLMQRKVAFVIGAGYVEAFGCDPSDILEKFASRSSRNNPAYGDFEILAADILGAYITLDKRSLTPTQNAWVSLIRGAQCDLRHYMWQEGSLRDREIRVGESDTAAAWTNGSTFVTFNSSELRKKMFVEGKPCIGNITEVFMLLFHELCHDTDSRDNVHSPDFYQAFHDMSSKYIGAVVNRACLRLTPQKYASLMNGHEHEEVEVTASA